MNQEDTYGSETRPERTFVQCPIYVPPEGRCVLAAGHSEDHRYNDPCCDFTTRGLRCMLPGGHPDDHAVIPCPVTDSLGRQCRLHRGHASDHVYPPPLCPTCQESHYPNEACRLEALARKETVNHPLHYGGDDTYEHWRVAVAWGLDKDAFLYNCTKYICRSGGAYVGAKNGAAPLEDLRKARWYLDRAIERLGKK